MGFWGHMKERRKFEHALIDQMETLKKILANIPRRAYPLPDIDEYKKTLKKFLVFDIDVSQSVTKFGKAYTASANYAKNLRAQQDFIKRHANPILVSEKNPSKYNTVNLSVLELQREALSRLESEISVLLNHLTKQYHLLTPKEGIAPDKLPEYLQLSQMLKNCAERVIDLGLATSLVDKTKKVGKLNPFQTFFLKKEPDIKTVLDEANSELALNNKTINHILSFVESTEKTNLLNLLLELRKHEMAIGLAKQFEIYENSVLRKLLNQSIKVLELAEKEIESVFSELSSGCQKKLLEKINSIEEMNKEWKNMWHKDQRALLEQKIVKESGRLKGYVNGLFEVSVVSKAQERLEEALNKLQKQKLLMNC